MKELDPVETQTYLKDHPEAQLVDVREDWEYAEGHLPGARHMPLATVPERWGELDRAHPVVVVCAAGGRSAKACQFLSTQGFTDLTNVLEGTKGWAKRGLPLET